MTEPWNGSRKQMRKYQSWPSVTDALVQDTPMAGICASAKVSAAAMDTPEP